MKADVCTDRLLKAGRYEHGEMCLFFTVVTITTDSRNKRVTKIFVSWCYLRQNSMHKSLYIAARTDHQL